jgi:hypothetical protein
MVSNLILLARKKITDSCKFPMLKRNMNLRTCCQEHIIMNSNCSWDDTAKTHAWENVTVVWLHVKHGEHEPTDPQQIMLSSHKKHRFAFKILVQRTLYSQKAFPQVTFFLTTKQHRQCANSSSYALDCIECTETSIMHHTWPMTNVLSP